MTGQRQGNPVERLGAATLETLAYAGGLCLLLASAARWLVVSVVSPRIHLLAPLSAQMVRVGVRSLPIVILVQAFIGVILALQMAPPLKPYGQENQISVIIGIAGFRMLGPIITAVVLSGFAGASIAAEIGTMVVAEEIEAMEAIALNPVRFLVTPRVTATLVMTVLLSVIADIMIALGGWVTARLVLSSSTYVGYWQRMRDSLEYRDLATGLIQAGVFGLLIGAIACYEGLKVRGGAEGVGSATTRTVVYSIVAIIASSCVFTMVFYVFDL